MCYKRPALCRPEREKLDLFELVGDVAEKEKNDENGGGVWVDLFDLDSIFIFCHSIYQSRLVLR